MRALLFDVHDDPRIWEFPHQYFFGDDLLVAPVTEPDAEVWQVYLPAGAWVDAWSGERIEGPRVLDRTVPLDVIPVYVREAAADALVPLFRATEGD
jgi:alpha-glucosidase (family GH31 glycosyl hydrolase)